MNIIALVEKFPDQHSCIKHLETVRWKDEPHCPYCGSYHVGKKSENRLIGRWNCYDWYSRFNVLQGTMMHKTRIPLQKWFVGIALMINAKKSLSACQMARDLEMDDKTCRYMQQRIRKAMSSKELQLLKDIVAIDETYVGGKPRYDKRYYDNLVKGGTKHKRGRGSKKTAVIGAVERNGNVVALMIQNVNGDTILSFLRTFVDMDETILVSDQFNGYNVVDEFIAHETINHREHYVVGDVYTNTIECFWSQFKRAWRGQHHHYTKRHMPLYIAEASWKFNNRFKPTEEVFDNFLETAMRPT